MGEGLATTKYAGHLAGVTIQQSDDRGLTFDVKLTKPPLEHIRSIVSQFARRAFRRPPTDDELSSFMALLRPNLIRGKASWLRFELP